jgi:TPR repeat protein
VARLLFCPTVFYEVSLQYSSSVTTTLRIPRSTQAVFFARRDLAAGQPALGTNPSIKHVAGHLLKQPARQGVVLAQSRLGLLMCRECGSPRDQRIGHDLLRQAARAGDPGAQQELNKIED